MKTFVWRFVTFVVCAALAGATHSSADTLRGAIVSSGGTPAAGIEDNGIFLRGTVGQPLVGTSGSGGAQIQCGYWAYGRPAVLAVDDPGTLSDALPTRLEFGRPSPNPARGTVRFALALPRPGRVSLVVHDVQGRLLSRVEPGVLSAGVHPLVWDTRGVGAGIHFVRLIVDGRDVASRRVIVVH